jgi:hypothetical protein
MSTKDLNALLQRVVDRNKDQKLIHIAKLRAELHDLGYSIVTTEWLNAVFNHMTAEDMDKVTREARK